MSIAQNPAVTTTNSRGLSAPVLVGGAFLLTTVLNILLQVAAIVFRDEDPHAPEGPINSIISISVVGVIGLAVALAVGIPLVRDPAKARIGAIVLGALALVTAPFFWSGAPAVLGAAAAWLAGLTKGGRPQTGVARGFGIIGFVVAILVIVATIVGYITSFAS
jgi:hypothetical protein